MTTATTELIEQSMVEYGEHVKYMNVYVKYMNESVEYSSMFVIYTIFKYKVVEYSGVKPEVILTNFTMDVAIHVSIVVIIEISKTIYVNLFSEMEVNIEMGFFSHLKLNLKLYFNFGATTTTITTTTTVTSAMLSITTNTTRLTTR